MRLGFNIHRFFRAFPNRHGDTSFGFLHKAVAMGDQDAVADRSIRCKAVTTGAAARTTNASASNCIANRCPAHDRAPAEKATNALGLPTDWDRIIVAVVVVVGVARCFHIPDVLPIPVRAPPIVREGTREERQSCGNPSE